MDKDELNDADVFVYAKAKMKQLHVIKSSEVEVVQYSNMEHEKRHELIRVNAPDSVEEGHTYKDATIGTIRGVSLKEG